MTSTIEASDKVKARLDCLKSELGMQSDDAIISYLMDRTAEQGRRILHAVGQGGEPLKIRVEDGVVWAAIDPSGIPKCILEGDRPLFMVFKPKAPNAHTANTQTER